MVCAGLDVLWLITRDVAHAEAQRCDVVMPVVDYGAGVCGMKGGQLKHVSWPIADLVNFINERWMALILRYFHEIMGEKRISA